MIRFEEEDSDPYTEIIVYEGEEIKAGRTVAFSLNDFERWLKAKAFPQSVEDAKTLLDEYDILNKKRVHDYHQQILGERRKEEEKSYSDRYAELKQCGQSKDAIHAKLFPEEYDFMFDDHVDATLRGQGVNPMSKEYVEEVNARRVAGGFSTLGSDDGETMQWCHSQSSA